MPPRTRSITPPSARTVPKRSEDPAPAGSGAAAAEGMAPWVSPGRVTWKAALPALPTEPSGARESTTMLYRPMSAVGIVTGTAKSGPVVVASRGPSEAFHRTSAGPGSNASPSTVTTLPEGPDDDGSMETSLAWGTHAHAAPKPNVPTATKLPTSTVRACSRLRTAVIVTAVVPAGPHLGRSPDRHRSSGTPRSCPHGRATFRRGRRESR